jgi:hydrogenase maturation factor
LAAVKPEAQEKVEIALNKLGLTPSILGKFTEKKERILIKKGKESVYPQVADDPYTMILSGK